MASPWISTLRLRTLPAAASPVLVGGAVAHALAGFHVAAFAAALAAALLIQIGTNLANDYFDHKKGADTPDRAGPRRASASGDLNPERVKEAALFAFVWAAFFGVYLVARGGWPILAIGVAGILSGWFYTAGRRALAYTGAADIFAFVFFGPSAVAGTVAVQTGDWPWQAWAWGIPLGLLTTAILNVNNLRDRLTDERVGKRTLAVRFGDRFTQLQWSIQVAVAVASPFVIGHLEDNLWLLLPVAAGLVAIAPGRLVWGNLQDRRQLNPALGGTARILLVFSLLATIGIII